MNVSNLKLELGLVISNPGQDRKDLVQTIYRVLAYVTIFVALISLLFRHQIATIYDAPDLADLLIWTPVAVLFFGLYQLSYYWLNSDNKFGTMAISKVVQTGSGEATKIISGVLNVGTFGLVAGRLMGVISAAAIGMFFMAKSTVKNTTKTSKEGMRAQLSKHKNLIFFSTPSQVLKVFVPFVALLLIVNEYGKETGGNFAVAIQYIGAAVAVLSSSFGQVYYNSIAKIVTKKTMIMDYLKWVKRLSIPAVALILSVHLIPTSLVVDGLGNQWSLLLPIARIMSIWLALSLVATSVSFIFIRLERQGTKLLLDTIHLLITIATLSYCLTNNYRLESTLWVYSIGQSLFYLCLLIVGYMSISKTKILS